MRHLHNIKINGSLLQLSAKLRGSLKTRIEDEKINSVFMQVPSGDNFGITSTFGGEFNPIIPLVVVPRKVKRYLSC